LWAGPLIGPVGLDGPPGRMNSSRGTQGRVALERGSLGRVTAGWLVAGEREGVGAGAGVEPSFALNM
ncbi:MAG TPA: hypothetical protein VNA24_26055, partial [Hyalangium sp.]|nr:hypothetical protein [Hyalangium sp.]